MKFTQEELLILYLGLKDPDTNKKMFESLTLAHVNFITRNINQYFIEKGIEEELDSTPWFEEDSLAFENSPAKGIAIDKKAYFTMSTSYKTVKGFRDLPNRKITTESKEDLVKIKEQVTNVVGSFGRKGK